MRNPRRLPQVLVDDAFSRADAADHAVTLGRLRRRDLARPFHGVRAAAAPITVLQRCHAYAVRMRPADVFSHVTAALLLGIPLPPKLEHRVAIDVAAVHPAAAPSTRGVIGHRLRSAPSAVLIEGLPVCAPAEVWCQLAGMLDLEDLVAAADHLLGDGRSPGLVTREELNAAIDLPGRYRAAPLRRAFGLCRVGSRSPQESRLRVILMLGGVPEPELNAEVTSRSGLILGHGDLVWPSRRTVSEYEGDQHRTDRDQYAYDIRRYDEFAAEGWSLVRVVAPEMQHQERPALIARMLRALGL